MQKVICEVWAVSGTGTRYKILVLPDALSTWRYDENRITGVDIAPIENGYDPRKLNDYLKQNGLRRLEWWEQ